ncbi:MAG: C39 family peptidase [Anaerolineales bacterium]|nr:MAG: C39 family peptidase [Anaerolineales bacterium]
MMARPTNILKRMVLLVAMLVPALNVRGSPLSIPNRAIISGVKGSAQNWNLSCESRSAVDWAAYWGVEITERQFLKRLPRSDNPDRGFVGNPNDVWGNVPPLSYGVHAEPVAKLLRDYGLQAEARRDMDWDDLRAEIAADHPVIVWVIGQMWRGTPIKYKPTEGHKTTVARYEHTMILYGYDRNKVHVIDAYTGNRQSYPIRTFLTSWQTLGNMAVVGSIPKAEIIASESEVQSETATPSVLNIYLPSIIQLSTTSNEQTTKDERPEEYTVKPGDYLMEISRRFGLSWQALARLNGIQYPFIIYPGQVLRLK